MLINSPNISGSLTVSGNTTVTGSLNVLGNVGIGTTSPGGKFHVIESGVGSGLDIPFNFSSTKTSLSGWTFTLNSGTSTGVLMGNRSGLPVIGTIGPSSLGINPDGGNVGIGTTNPLTKLQLDSTSGTTLRVRTSTSGGTEPGVDFLHEGNDLYSIKGGSHLRFLGSGGAIEHMRIQFGGNVGIGTNSPNSKLQVAGNVNIGTVLPLLLSNDTSQPNIVNGIYYTTDNSGYGMALGKIVSGTKTNQLIIRDSGNVLIGTTTDNGSKLQVNGNITANNIFLSGTSINLATDSTWSTYKTIISPGALQAGRTYLISVQWNFSTIANNPYYCYTSFLFQAVSTNGTGTVNEITPICSNHVGIGTMTISFRSISGASSTSGLQAQLNNFATFVGNITVKYILLE